MFFFSRFIMILNVIHSRIARRGRDREKKTQKQNLLIYQSLPINWAHYVFTSSHSHCAVSSFIRVHAWTIFFSRLYPPRAVRCTAQWEKFFRPRNQWSMSIEFNVFFLLLFFRFIPTFACSFFLTRKSNMHRAKLIVRREHICRAQTVWIADSCRIVKCWWWWEAQLHFPNTSETESNSIWIQNSHRAVWHLSRWGVKTKEK